MSLKILFYGTPAVAVPYLDFLAKHEQVVAVVSQPDKPAGRSLKIEPTPVKAKALELQLPWIFQPTKSTHDIREYYSAPQPLEAFKQIFPGALPVTSSKDPNGLNPDLSVVVAYGKLITPINLAIPKLGTLNIHFSLLPKYRGAAPVQWSLVRGEKKTGVTLFWLDEGMDTGPIFFQKETEVGPDEDAPSLMDRLTKLGVEALGEVLDEIKAGRIVRKPQEGEASLAPLIKKEDAKVDLSRPAGEIRNLVRGFRGWPKAWLQLKGRRVQILRAELSEDAGTGRPGAILSVDRTGGILVQCGGRSRLWLLEVQPEGKKPVTAADFLNGLRLAAGDSLPIE